MHHSQHHLSRKLAEWILSEYSSDQTTYEDKIREKMFPGIYLFDKNIKIKEQEKEYLD
jgi:hypothetical protein